MRAAAPALAVENGYLEFMAPGLPEAGARLAAAGCTIVDIVPLFLGAGGHVRKDLPEGVARLRAAHPAVAWRLREPIGELDAVIDAMAAAALRMTGDDAASVR
jgi:sirohydrochlorin cobaltochelatase